MTRKFDEITAKTYKTLVGSDKDDSFQKIELKKLIQDAVHWCFVNGLVVVPIDVKPIDLMSVTYLPFTLYPSRFSKRLFQKVFDLQPKINTLIYRLANSQKYMENIFTDLALSDKFISSLWSIYKSSLAEGYNQNISLQILRSDYMLHQSKESPDIDIKQVEINTMAASPASNSGLIVRLHKQILDWSNLSSNDVTKLAENEPIKKFANGFVEAWRLYNVKEAIIVFVVLEWEKNFADQRSTEYEIIRQEKGIKIRRCTLKELHTHSRTDENKILFYENQEVALVYFRAAYAPDHFETENDWKALKMIELSKAIKCPNVAVFLAGMKKVQEFLYYDELGLSDLCGNDKDLVSLHQSVYARFLKLSDKDDFETVLKNPDEFVLKPQREGGGNNFYNDQIKVLLMSMLEDREVSNYENELVTNKQRYIVMERLKPAVVENVLISSRAQKKLAISGEMVGVSQITNELGMFGVLVRNGSDVVLNETCGYLLRSKLANDNEGGVMAGSGAFDSIYLVD